MPGLSRRALITGAASAVVTAGCASPPRNGRRSAAPVPFDRERFLQDVQDARPDGQAAVAEVLARAVSDPPSVVRGLGEPSGAAVELLYRDAELSIFNVVWPPLVVLGAHEHRMWASIGVYAGRENNVVWRPAGATIEAADATSVAAREVFSLPPDGIHSVTNPVEAYTAAIHVYGGDLSATPRSQWDALTLSREPFDLDDARRVLRQADERFRAAG